MAAWAAERTAIEAVTRAEARAVAREEAAAVAQIAARRHQPKQAKEGAAVAAAGEEDVEQKTLPRFRQGARRRQQRWN